ncbi:MAG: hypothetical protein ACI9XP_000754 [Lentimonas sp.]|jgi:hypothetical protein
MRCKTLIVLGLISIFTACEKQDARPDIELFGHAGMGLNQSYSLTKSDSKEAFESCLSFSEMTGVEMDVQMDKQGEFWFYHGDFVESKNGDFCIPELTTEEVRKLEISGRKEGLLKVRDFPFENYPNAKFLFDIKHYNAAQQKIIDSTLFFDNMSDFLKGKNINIEFITLVKVWLPSFINRNWFVYYDSQSSADIDIVISEPSEVKGISTRASLFNKDEIKALKDKNIKVLLFGINSPKAHKKIRKLAPSGIITDDVRGAILELR